LLDIQFNALRPKEFVYTPSNIHEGKVSLGTGIWLTENKLPTQAVSLEDYVLSKFVIPYELPFFGAETPVVRWYTRELKRMINANEDVRSYLAAQRDSWHTILTDQNNKWATMRDILVPGTILTDQDKEWVNKDDVQASTSYRKGSKTTWQFLLIDEEYNDLFRYLLGETDTDKEINAALPDYILNSPDFATQRENITALINGELLPNGRYHPATISKRVGPAVVAREPKLLEKITAKLTEEIHKKGSEYYGLEVGSAKVQDAIKARLGSQKKRLAEVRFAHEIQDLVEQNFGPFVLGVREQLRLPRGDKERSEFGALKFTITKYILDSRFWSNSSSKAPVQSRRAAFFWTATGTVLAGLYVYVIYNLVGHVDFMPLPYEVNLPILHTILPWWTRIAFIGLSLIPLPDMVLLTFSGLQFMGKGFLRSYMSKHYDFAHVKTYKATLRILPALIANNPDFRNKLSLTLKVWYERTRLSAEERDTLDELIAAVEAPAEHDIKQVVGKLQSISSKKVRLGLMNFVNKFYRKDMPVSPKNLWELIAQQKEVTALSDNPWLEFKQLNALDGLQTQLGMYASTYPEEWNVLMSQLEEKNLIGIGQKEELLKLKAHPNYILKTLDTPESIAAVEAIEWYMNMNLNSGYANIISAQAVRSVVYDYYLKQWFPGDANSQLREELKHALVQLILSHDQYNLDLETALRDITHNKDLDLNDFIADLMAGRETIPQTMLELANAGKVIEVNKRKQPAAKFVRSLQLAARYDIYLSKGRFAREKSNIGDEKYTSLKANIPFMRGEISSRLDWDHYHLIEELWAEPNVGVLFSVDEQFSGAPYNVRVYSKPVSKTAKAMTDMEEGWINGEQPAKA
jgi:hypothetical protein